MFLSLFLRELRRSFVTALLVMGGMFGAIMLIERLYILLARYLTSAVEPSLDLRGLMRLLLPLCCYGLGAATFSRRVKETHFLFLQTLPMNRHWVWLALVSSRVLALLAAIPITFVVLAVVWNPEIR